MSAYNFEVFQRPRRGGRPRTGLISSGKQPADALHLSFDRKVSPRGTQQTRARQRWIPTVPNSFGLPSGITCPGRTSFCGSCYAANTERYQGVAGKLAHNLALLEQASSTEAMAELLVEMLGRYQAHADAARIPPRERIFRIHWDGDFWSTAYARAWRQAIEAHPAIGFWTYTRSFGEPLDVVAELAGLPNLALYLSVDADNRIAAAFAADRHPGVLLALCADDYEHGRLLGFAGRRPPTPCPENAERLPLMGDDGTGNGRGACVACMLCPDGRRDILFATSHREQALPFPSRRRAHA